VARFYADEDFPYPVVVALRALGHDVLTVQEVKKTGGTDATVLADATALDRIVLTHNRKHFIRLHRSAASHSGIVVCTVDRDTNGLARRIDGAVAAADPAGGRLVRQPTQQVSRRARAKRPPRGRPIVPVR
jgi:hypothetical protein